MFQFIHVETYALKASTKQRPVKPPKDGKAPINPTKVKNKYSAGQIIDEVYANLMPCLMSKIRKNLTSF